MMEQPTQEQGRWYQMGYDKAKEEDSTLLAALVGISDQASSAANAEALTETAIRLLFEFIARDAKVAIAKAKGA